MAKKKITFLVLLLIITFAFRLAASRAWQNPTAAPPGGNLAAPVNVGSASQTKTGSLTVGGLTVSGAASATSLQIASGATKIREVTNTAALDFPSLGQGSCSELTITVTGAATGDDVSLGPPATIEAGFGWSGFVSSANTVTVRLCKHTTSATDPASATWRATARGF